MTKLKTTKNIKEWTVSAGYAPKLVVCVKQERENRNPHRMKISIPTWNRMQLFALEKIHDDDLLRKDKAKKIKLK